MNIVFSEQADKALVNIYDYIGIQNDNPRSAEREIRKIIDKLALLATSPKLGRVLNQTTRFLVVDKYIVVYKIKAEHIFIAAIYTAGQNWRTHYTEL